MNNNEFISKYAYNLNPNQLEAVQTVDGAVLLLAVPGSGKTTVLITRLGYMLSCCGILPSDILTLTYTVAATHDMSNRFKSMFGDEIGNAVEFRTINGICAKIIQRYADMIGKPSFQLETDEKKLARVIAEILQKQLREYPTESEIKNAKTLITFCKNMMFNEDEIKEYSEDLDIDLLDLYKEYNKYLRDNSLMDYDDQMIYAYRLLKLSPELLEYYRNQYKYICVDEAQDTSKIQHIIIKLLAGENGNLFMVGDEDQSIYGFRAAYPEALLNFENDHPGAKVLIMNQNYRSNAKIVSVADSFIQRNQSRHEKHMVATREADSDINYVNLDKRYNQYNYLVKVAEKCSRETAVLYRDNESALPLVDMLDRQGISYRIKGNDMVFFTHRVVNDITNILSFALNPSDIELFMKIYFKCSTYLKKSQAEALCKVAAKRNIPILEAVNNIEGISSYSVAKCRALATNIRKLKSEPLPKAFFRIENPMGYGDYLDRNNLDKNKLYILKMLCYRENSIKSYLDRLTYLREKLTNMRPDYNSNFILSTIHSSKGLEYDRVYIMDACDGVFPSRMVKGSKDEADKKYFEEERRLFYVAMTRAKNELAIFSFDDNSSCFINEAKGMGSLETGRNEHTVSSVAESNVFIEKASISNADYVSNYDPVIGESVLQKKYGKGVIVDVYYGNEGVANRIIVEFNSGDTKSFAFPAALKYGMEIVDRKDVTVEKVKKKSVDINRSKAIDKAFDRYKTKTVEKKNAENRSKSKSNTYAYWADKYPDHVIVKREGAFWTCRGESAVTLSSVLGYNLGGSGNKPVTGSPKLEPIVDGLKHNAISYIVVDNGEMIDIETYG